MPSHAEQGLALLRTAWQEAQAIGAADAVTPFDQLVDRVFKGQEVGYKKAIIIQAAGKAADPTLDAQAMQKGEGDASSWDAREFAKQTFVIWNKEASEPFSHSTDPYVSNPYRIRRFDGFQRAGRKRKVEFDNTLLVLEHLNGALDSTSALDNLRAILAGLKRYIADKDVSYPLPNRASLRSTTSAIKTFLQVPSGGTRLQAIVAALFKTLAVAGLNIGEVISTHVNASDKASKKAGDVVFPQGEGSFAAEVKDRKLNAAEVASSIVKARIAGTTDLMFVVRANALFEHGYDEETFWATAQAEFSSGLNLYVEKFDDFARVCLSLVGERARRTFLEQVGQSLAEQKADIGHKWAWSAIVRAI